MMKTIKALTITSVLQGIFCLFCVVSTLCFAVHRYSDADIWFSIGMITMVGWAINPIGIVSFTCCLVAFLAEHKEPEEKPVLGKKWVWIFVWPIITTLLWLLSGALFVTFTGGV